MTYALATAHINGVDQACLECHGRFYPLAQLQLPSDLMALMADWTALEPKVAAVAAQVDPSKGYAPDEVRVLSPLRFPGKVMCAGANYFDHLAEMGVEDLRKESQRLFFFYKPPSSSIIGPGDVVEYPLGTEMFDWEVELAIVIGRKSKRLTLENALDCVAGYTVAIDLSARDFNRAPETFYKLDWVAGKAQDTCCPLGPRIIPASELGDAQNLPISLAVNGVTKQDANTSGMVFGLREILVTLSNIMTLEPGDVVLTGTPAGVGMPKRTFLKAGDTVRAEIGGIGTLNVTIGPSV